MPEPICPDCGASVPRAVFAGPGRCGTCAVKEEARRVAVPCARCGASIGQRGHTMCGACRLVAKPAPGAYCPRCASTYGRAKDTGEPCHVCGGPVTWEA